jgi:signal transduction histidine kinase
VTCHYEGLMPDDRFARARIAIVEDDPNVVRVLKRLLKREGFVSVAAVADPRQFPAAYAAEPPDLIVVDLLMPGLSGFDVLAQVAGLTEDRPRPPVLMLTAGSTYEARERALAGGAMDFVTQPFDRLDVLLRVRNLLARRFLELDLWRHSQLLESRIAERTHELQESVDQLRETSRQRRELALRLVTAEEEERRRIAAELHDGSVQTMAALSIRLGLLGRRLVDPDERSEMDQLRAILSEAQTQIRTLMSELRTPNLDQNGLEAALRQCVTRMAEAGGPPVKLEVNTDSELPTEERVVLYRIAQEALANVRKHANARAVTVTVNEEGEGLKLSVCDDGRGFDAGRGDVPGHLGLTMMKERAAVAGGWCRVESAPGAGTTVAAWVPFAPVEPGPTG